MRFYYSGAQDFNFPQTDFRKSLGGKISSTEIPNGRINNLFDDVSLLSNYEEFTDIKGIFLKNTLGKAVSNVCLYTLSSNVNDTFELAAVSVDQNKPAMEVLRSSRDLPYYSDFVSPKDVKTYSVVKVSGNVVPGNIITIVNKNITAPTDKIPDLIQAIQTTFYNDPIYSIVTNSSDPNSFNIVFNSIQAYTGVPTIVSAYTIFSASAYTGVDGSRLLKNSLPDGGVIGLWFKKTNSIVSNAIVTDEQIEKLLSDFRANHMLPLQNNDLQSLEIHLTWT